MERLVMDMTEWSGRTCFGRAPRECESGTRG